jgi:hypothetical protein
MVLAMSVSDRALSVPAPSVQPSVSKILLTPVRALAFWTAVVLPLTYLPVLATGLDSLQMGLAFVALLAVNVCALVVGQPYGRRS